MKDNKIYNKHDNSIMVRTDGDIIYVICNKESQQDIVVQKMTTKNCILDSYEEWDEGDDMNSQPSRDPPSLDTVRVLLSGSLDSVILEDIDEMNAVEYALVSDADIEVVNLLQRATQRVMKKKNPSRSSVPPQRTSINGSMSRVSVH